MEHHDITSAVLIVIFVILLARLAKVEIKDTDSGIGYYIILLQIMTLAFDNLYDSFGDTCL